MSNDKDICIRERGPGNTVIHAKSSQGTKATKGDLNHLREQKLKREMAREINELKVKQKRREMT